jgi:hypothetical protein
MTLEAFGRPPKRRPHWIVRAWIGVGLVAAASDGAIVVREKCLAHQGSILQNFVSDEFI